MVRRHRRAVDQRRSGAPRRSVLALGLAFGVTALAQAPSRAAVTAAGPRKLIAIAKFDSDTTFDKAYGTADPGGGLAAQMATELVNSGDFLVVERSNLDAVLAEQALGAQQRVTADTAAKVGDLLGAQILVRASVTMFEPQTRSNGFSIGFGGAAITHGASSGQMGIDLRLIDTTTGQVVAATHIEQAVKATSNSVGYTSGPASLGSSDGDSTVIGTASRGMIDKAVAFIRVKLADIAWTGRVSDADASGVYLNVGAEGGVAVGDRFTISRISKRITDPTSGELLGVIEDKLGVVTVSAVQPRFSVAVADGDFKAARGDIARSVKT